MKWLFASPAEQRLLPGGGVRATTPWLIVIIVFLMMTIAAAALALSNGAGLVAAGINQRYSVQIVGGAARMPQAVAAAKAAPGVASVRPVTDAEMRATLERWLGPQGAAADLPLPAMIDVDLAPGADPVAVGKRIEAAAPGARFVAHADSLAPLLGALRSLSWLAVGLVLLVALANAAVVVLATRSALDTNRATIEILHGIGATDTQIAHLFQRRIAIDALIGGIGGGIAAGIVMVLLLGTGSGWVADLAGGTLLHGRDMALLALLPLLVAIMATVVARIAVLSTLRANL